MPAFTIMAHALARELADRGIALTIDECADILTKVVDRVAVAAEQLPVRPRHEPRESR